MKKMGMGAVALMMGAGVASADVLEFNIDTVFSSDQANGYVNVKFEDSGGDVKLTLTSFLEGDEFIGGGESSGIYLNFNTALNVLLLSKSGDSGSGSYDAPNFEVGTNMFMADGDGSYDIRIRFGNGGGAFDDSDVFMTTLSYSAGDITVDDFKFLSQPPTGGHGPFLAAAHIQGTDGTEGSGWHSPTLVPLPQPVYYGLAGLGLAGAVSVIKRRR